MRFDPYYESPGIQAELGLILKSNKHNPSVKSGLYICISSRITIGIQNWMTVKETITVLMSHSQFHRIKAYT